MQDPDYSFWACTQAITDGPDDGPSSRENPTKVDDFGYIILNGMANNECYILKEGENTIGRHPLNHIYIEHQSVSMSHAVIQCDSDGVVLLDKGSLNKTRLNKKILKKNVAYFLDENALLVFGEVQANYYVNPVPSEFTDVKASNDTLVRRTIGIDGVSVPKFSNTISTPNNLYTLETFNTISGSDVPLMTENNSACRTETTVLNFIAESDHAKNNLNDVHCDLNSPSPSDEFLLDAISQIENNEIKVNSPELLLPNENTSSPVMNLADSMPITHMPRIDDDILSVSDIQRLCTEIIPVDTREDTPSPVMDLGPLIDYDDRSSVQKPDNHNVPKIDNSSPEQDLTQSITTEHVLRIENNISLVSDMQELCTGVMAKATREDTPSPVMDLGPLIEYNDSLSVQENINHGILSSIKSADKGGELNETQLMAIENNVSENCTQIFPTKNLPNTNITFQVSKSLSVPTTLNNKNESNMLDECTQLPVMDNEDLLLLTSRSVSVNCNSQIEDEKSSDLGTFNKVKSDNITKKIKLNNGNNSTNHTKKLSATKKEYIIEHNQNIFDENDDIFISADQKIKSLETQRKNILQTNITNNISVLNNTKSNNSCLNKSEFDFSVQSTSTYTYSKTETVLPNKSACKQNENTFEADDDDIFKDFIKKEFNSQSHTSTTKTEKYFSNCPMQRVCLSLNEKDTHSSLETSPQCKKKCLDSSNTGSTCKSNDLNPASDIADNDFFNCPTQKVSISKKMNEMKKLSPSIHEQETQPQPDFSFPKKTYIGKPNTHYTGKNKDLSFQMNDDDFFNCPTQKLSISKKNEMKNVSQSIYEQETQPFTGLSSQHRKSYLGTPTDSTSKNKDIIQVLEKDVDFFNCPTQKLSISKNINEIKKIPQSIHEQETQPIPDLTIQPKKPYLSMPNHDSTSKNKDLGFEMDDDDFFNCPTQKISISKKMNEIKKLSLSIHDEETQPIADLPTEPRKTDIVMSNTTLTSKSKYLNHKMDDEDFFNCPTQKISISKKMDDVKKTSLSIHEQETQPIPDLTIQPKKPYLSIPNHDSTSKNKDLGFEMDDDDFFNCPTQKVSISKKMNEIKKLSLSIHDEETQLIADLPTEPRKTDIVMSNTTLTSKSKYLNHKMDDEDFFNCPTQKISISKKMDDVKKTSLSIHEQETQPIPDLTIQPKKPYLSIPNHDSTSKNKDLGFEMDDDDFFNCPTQKVSISKKMNEIKKLSLSIHDEETQPIADLPTEPRKKDKVMSNTTLTSKSKYLNHKMDDEDFFNCPTQKISISKKRDDMKKTSLSIHEQETQPIPDLPMQPKKPYLSMPNHDSTSKNKDLGFEMDDDDFFNCPTQKVSISKKMNEIKKLSLSIHDEETQPIADLPTEPRKKDKVMSNTTLTSKSKYLNHKMDDEDFFNCPTQKISISKKRDDMKKTSLSIHEQETQPIPDLPMQPKKPYLSMPNHDSTSKNKDLGFEMDDDDFFNCPTQKVSISKKMNEIKKLSLSIHDEETQPIADLPTEPRKTDIVMSNTTLTSKSKYLNHKMDDEDFFNCPTQKISISKNINEIKKIPQSIHEQETQPIPDLPIQPKKPYLSMPNHDSTSKNKDLDFEMDDDDFFNCPTQKVSISKKMNELKKLSLSIHNEETQPIADLPTEPRKTDIVMSNTTLTSKSKYLNLKMDDEDFFNCPTQKISISKKMDDMKKTSPSIHEQETQPISDLSSQPRKSCISLSNTNSIIKSEDLNPEIIEDFFNCPTQPFPDNSPPSNTCKRYFNNQVINSHQDLTQALETDEDFFNHPTQPLPDKLLPNKTNTTNFYSRATVSHNDLTQYSLEDENGLNRNAQIPLSYEKSFTDNKKQNIFNINEAETQELSSVEVSTVSIVKINAPDKIKQNKENIFNCSTQKASTKIQLNTNKDETEGQASVNNGIPYGAKSNIIQGKSKRFCYINPSDEHEFSNQKQSPVSVPSDIHMIRKSSRIHSMSINKPNAQLSAARYQNIKKSKTNDKPIIHVRKDLHVTGFKNSVNYPDCINKSNQNTGDNNIKTSTNNNIVQPSCTKITPDDDSDLILLASIKKELLTDESEQHQLEDFHPLRHKNHSKQNNEATFSTSIKPCASTNSPLDQHQNPKPIQKNADLPNCQPSTSNNSSLQWKSFWNQKKMLSQNEGKSGNQKNTANTNDIVKKERYQTRANTKKDNTEEFNRKRKQDVNTEEGNKRMCKNNVADRLNPPVQDTSDIVVTFSYLKSRNLLEMKQFVETTGGYVTDEITECTVLVTDKVRCSMKVLSAIAKGCPIVDANWVKHSYTVKMFQDVDEFIISDKDAERKHKFKLKESLSRAKAKGLLDGYTVMVTPSVKPSPKDMKVIITCAGGNYVMNWPKKRHPNELIVTCEQDRRRWKPLWDNNKAKTIDNDAFIMSIMRQKLSV